MNVRGSVLKHGILHEDVIQAAEWSIWVEDLDDDSPARQLRLGFDTRGRLLELDGFCAREFASDLALGNGVDAV